MSARAACVAGLRVVLRRGGDLAHAAVRTVRRRAHDLRSRLAYEKIEGLRAEIIKETLKGLDL